MCRNMRQDALKAAFTIAGCVCTLSLLSRPASCQTVPAADSSPASSLHTGPYYALIIGNQNYKHLPMLTTPISDANAVAKLLHEQYGFQTEVLLDADREQILAALVKYRKTLPENSNLLIYYAGHGHHDRDADEAYWLPVDAQTDNNANWISADEITHDLKAMAASHILIISDSCYAGYLVPSRSANAGINPLERNALLAKMLRSRSRNLMASGGDEPVADSGAPGHSIFAAALLQALTQMDEANFNAGDLFDRFVQPKVGGKSDQLPEYSWIRNSGHESGDFVFSRAAREVQDQSAGDQQQRESQGPILILKAESQPTTTTASVAPATAIPAKIAIIQYQQAVSATNEGQRDYAELHKKKDAQDDSQKEIGDAYQKLSEKLFQVVQTYAAQSGYTLVLDASAKESPVLWTTQDADISQAVVAAYNQKSGIPAQSGGSPLTSVSAVTTAIPAKVAIIQFQQAVGATSEGQRDFDELRKKYEPKKNQLQTQSDEIDALKKQLQTQSATLSDSARAALTRSVDEKTVSLQRFAEEVQNDFQKDMAETYQKLAEKVYQVLRTYAAQSGYTQVLDASAKESPVLWTTQDTDISQAVVAAYNQKSGILAQPGASPPAPVSTSAAVPAKVAIIQFQQAVSATTEGQRNFAELRKKYEPKQNQLKTQSDEIDVLKKQLKTQSATLGDSARAVLNRSIEEKTKSLQHAAEDAQKDFQKEFGDSYQKLAEKVYQVMQTYAAQSGYTQVLDTSAEKSPVLWATQGTDISQAVVAAYNQKSGTNPP